MRRLGCGSRRASGRAAALQSCMPACQQSSNAMRKDQPNSRAAHLTRRPTIRKRKLTEMFTCSKQTSEVSRVATLGGQDQPCSMACHAAAYAA